MAVSLLATNANTRVPSSIQRFVSYELLHYFAIEFPSPFDRKSHWLQPGEEAGVMRRVINHFDESTRKRFILSQLS